MKARGSWRFGFVVLLLGVVWCTPVAGGVIVNGDFETGDLTSWQVTLQPGSSSPTFSASSGTATPINGFATVGPHQGAWYAVSDQDAPTAAALWQEFTVPGPAALATLSFWMFVNDQSLAGPLGNGSALDYTIVPNQHARVDLLRSGALRRRGNLRRRGS